MAELVNLSNLSTSMKTRFGSSDRSYIGTGIINTSGSITGSTIKSINTVDIDSWRLETLSDGVLRFSFKG